MVSRGRRIANNPNYENELMARIVSNSVMGDGDDDKACWIWIRQRQNNGYGAVRAYGRVMPAHRASFLAFKGPIPQGMEVGHSCHKRFCVNPNHLKAMTHADNMREMVDLRYGSKKQ